MRRLRRVKRYQAQSTGLESCSAHVTANCSTFGCDLTFDETIDDLASSWLLQCVSRVSLLEQPTVRALDTA